MNNNIISSVVSNKCLGVDLDDRLTFDINIEEIYKKICSSIGALRRIKPFVPQSSLVTLYKSLIQPYFDYCSPLWDTYDKILKDKLKILQNRGGGQGGQGPQRFQKCPFKSALPIGLRQVKNSK